MSTLTQALTTLLGTDPVWGTLLDDLHRIDGHPDPVAALEVVGRDDAVPSITVTDGASFYQLARTVIDVPETRTAVYSVGNAHTGRLYAAAKAHATAQEG